MSAMKNAHVALTDPNAVVQHIGDEDMVVISRGKDHWDMDGCIHRNIWDVVIMKDDRVIYHAADLNTPSYFSDEEAMASILSFLYAAGEAYQSETMHESWSENIDMFPMAVTEWAYQHMDEIGMAELDLSGGEDY